MLVSLVAALDYNRVIGCGGALPWHLPADLRRFKTLTLGHPIVMGRRTFESIGNPLKGRTNIVVTRRMGYSAPGCLVAHDLDEAFTLAGAAPEVMIIGGRLLYDATIEWADRMYLTVVHGEFDGDKYFPQFSLNEWLLESARHYAANADNTYPTSTYTLTRRRIPIRDHPMVAGIPVEMRARTSRAHNVSGAHKAIK